VLDLDSAEQALLRASKSASAGNSAEAVAALVEADNTVTGLLAWRDWMWGNLKTVWEKSRYEKGRGAGGRTFLHVQDDLKDHFADRRPGLEYMLAPFEGLKLDAWRDSLTVRIKEYAAANKVEVRGLAGE
jgi:hexosaminidase